MITPQAALNRLIDHNELFYDEMQDIMRLIMQGKLPPLVTAALLLGLRVKGESVQEIAAAASVLREFTIPVPVQCRDYLVDTCGTGGDHLSTFNISTAAAIVAAAAGARVAKHGNRSVSSRSGSADVMEKLGVALSLTPKQVGQCIDRIGLGFIFAPNHHQAMKHVAPIRKELGVRTLFNILGPLINPAQATNQVIGVFHPDLVGIQARVLKELGSQHVLVVHGSDGLDEITLSGPTWVAELKDNRIKEYQLEPAHFGLSMASSRALSAASAEESSEIIHAVLAGKAGAAADCVIINAAAALYTANVVSSLEEGVARARCVSERSGKTKIG